MDATDAQPVIALNVWDSTSSSEDATSTALTLTNMKPRRARTKSGCLCCRLRAKKCNEVIPICSGCRRNSLICAWPVAKSTATGTPASDLGWRLDLQSGKAFEAYIPLLELHQNHGFVSICTNINYDGTAPPAALLRELQACLQPHITGGVTRTLQLRPKNKALTDPISWTLLDHFVRRTGLEVVGTAPEVNPWLKLVLPQAMQKDSPVLYAMLALSGIHLAHNRQDSVIKHHALVCYNRAVTDMRQGIADWSPSAHDSTLDLLTTAILLYQIEALGANAEVLAYQHLRASRELILAALDSQQDGQQQDAFGFVLEFYVYFTILGTLTASTPKRRRVLLSDWFVRSLQHLHKYSTFGSMLGYARELFEIIATISLLDSDIENDPSSARIVYAQLKDSIKAWTPQHAISPDQQLEPDTITSGLIFQQATFVLLNFWYSRLEQTCQETILEEVAAHVSETVTLMTKLEYATPIQTTLLWPFMVIGSCATTHIQRWLFTKALTDSPYKMPIVNSAVKVLDQVWKKSRSGVMGLVVLQDILEKTGFAMS